jgi:hypothetical protein
MVSRSTLKAMARLALAAMLFSQAALALAACESVRRVPAIALAEHRIDGETCHEQGRNLNLCLAHCLGGDQSLDKPLVKVPALAGAPILSVPMLRASLHDACAPRHLGVPPAAAPPPRILFQSLLI